MFVEATDLDALKELQDVDLELMRVRRERAALPQREKIAEIIRKRTEIVAKADQIATLQGNAETELEKVEVEDAQIAEKQRRAQELIDNAGTDYRSIESHSRELAGFAKRRTTLEGKMEGLSQELERIGALKAKVDAALNALASQERTLRAQFAEQDGALALEEKSHAQKRDSITAMLPADLVALYETTAEKTKGVAVGMLVDDRCGVCRTTIEGGRLIELRANAPLGVCPSCKRLLIVE